MAKAIKWQLTDREAKAREECQAATKRAMVYLEAMHGSSCSIIIADGWSMTQRCIDNHVGIFSPLHRTLGQIIEMFEVEKREKQRV